MKPASKPVKARPFWPAAVFLLAYLLVASPLHAQRRPSQLEEYQAKALLIFNFAKFVIWPGDAFATHENTFVIDVVGEDPFGGSFFFIKNKTVQERTVVIRKCAFLEQCYNSQIIYIDQGDTADLQSELERLHAEHTLIITSDPALFEAGAMVLITVKGDRLAFDVNLPAARKAGLEVSGNLLRHADRVILKKKREEGGT